MNLWKRRRKSTSPHNRSIWFVFDDRFNLQSPSGFVRDSLAFERIDTLSAALRRIFLASATTVTFAKTNLGEKIVRTTACLCAMMCAIVGTAKADMIIDTVGDDDGLGGHTGAVDGGTIVGGVFDNRSAAELGATDGSQFTDRSTDQFGSLLDFIDFNHTFAAPTTAITSVTLEFGVAGIQSNDNNPLTKLSGEEGLFVDGVLIADAFESLEQGAAGYNVFSVTLPSTVFGQFVDGNAVIRIDSNSFGGNSPPGGTDPAYYDFSRITIVTVDAPVPAVPEPASIAMFSIGILGFAGWRRLRK